MNNAHSALLVAVIALVTLALRCIPFLAFGGKRKTPGYVIYLGKVLPGAIMGMLVIYCLKDASVFAFPYGLPELLACGVVVLLYLWRRSTLISIVGGTVCYMLLIQTVFTV